MKTKFYFKGVQRKYSDLNIIGFFDWEIFRYEPSNVNKIGLFMDYCKINRTEKIIFGHIYANSLIDAELLLLDFEETLEPKYFNQLKQLN